MQQNECKPILDTFDVYRRTRLTTFMSYIISYLYLRYTYPSNTTALATHIASLTLVSSLFGEPSRLSKEPTRLMPVRRVEDEAKSEYVQTN
jgi:hypothetical protein